jgi:hypothetical protein
MKWEKHKRESLSYHLFDSGRNSQTPSGAYSRIILGTDKVLRCFFSYHPSVLGASYNSDILTRFDIA